MKSRPSRSISSLLPTTIDWLAIVLGASLVVANMQFLRALPAAFSVFWVRWWYPCMNRSGYIDKQDYCAITRPEFAGLANLLLPLLVAVLAVALLIYRRKFLAQLIAGVLVVQLTLLVINYIGVPFRYSVVMQPIFYVLLVLLALAGICIKYLRGPSLSAPMNKPFIVRVLLVVLAIVIIAGVAMAVSVSREDRLSMPELSNAVASPYTRTYSPSVSPSPTSAPILASDNASILAAASEQCNASGNTKYGATLDYAPLVIGDSAQVGVHCTGYISGHIDFLKKANGVWSIVYAGQDAPSKAIGEKYSLPTSWY